MSNQNNDELMSENDAATEHHLTMGEALDRLRQNPDFKTVILNGYLKEKVLASVSLLGVPQEKARRVDVMEDLIAGSNLQYFFSMVDQFHHGAKDPVLSDEEEAELAAHNQEH